MSMAEFLTMWLIKFGDDWISLRVLEDRVDFAELREYGNKAIKEGLIEQLRGLAMGVHYRVSSAGKQFIKGE